MPNMGGGGAGGLEIDSSEPSTKTAGMIWVDTDSNKTFRRNDDNTAWINLQYVDDGIVLDQSTTFSDFSQADAVTSVSSTASDATLEVNTSVGNNWSITGAGNSTYNEFSAGHSAIGVVFTQVEIYAKATSTAGHTFRFFYCKTSTGAIGSGWEYLNQNFSPVIGTSAGWRATPTFGAKILQAGDQFRMGLNEAQTLTTYGTTSEVTGSKIHTGASGYSCGNAGSSESNGAFGLKLLQTFASSNLILAAEGAFWKSNAETNPNCVLDLGSAKDIGQIALYWSSASTETQILIQTSTNGSDWTTVRTINSTSLTDDTTNYIRFNLINGRYVRIYGNSGDSKVLAVKADMRINPSLGDHEHIDISSSDTTLPLDGT